MYTKQPIQHLVRVTDLREVWENEATSFTRWLGEAENLRILGDTIGKELELVEIEQRVGPYRADVVCVETNSNNKVLIENQLERTDHAHLGQLLTYAPNDANVTLVWIAREFTEEHRAALDWLNRVTNESVEFFGLEIELWRISDSPIAPKFNMVCKPNDWSREPDPVQTETSEIKLIQQEFWSGLRDVITERGGTLRAQKPLPQQWTTFAIGKSNCSLFAAVNSQENSARLGFSVRGPLRKQIFEQLQAERDQIESVIEQALEWYTTSSGKEYQARLFLKDVNLANRSSWRATHERMADVLQRLHVAFALRVAEC